MEAVVGIGVWAFWFVRICSRDTNLADYRGDFLSRRINKDLPDVRLHPQRANQPSTGRREAFFPVYGKWEYWRSCTSALGGAKAALATPQGRQAGPLG